MTSAERVLDYGKLESEAPLSASKAIRESEETENALEFRKVHLKYGKEDKYVLKDVNFAIRKGEKVQWKFKQDKHNSINTIGIHYKVGIVGRTGAGKSSLITALFRIAEPEGVILLRGVPTALMGLHQLRTSVSIIPQDPLLFRGSLRKNLDPFDEFDDAAVWDAIRKVKHYFT